MKVDDIFKYVFPGFGIPENDLNMKRCVLANMYLEFPKMIQNQIQTSRRLSGHQLNECLLWNDDREIYIYCSWVAKLDRLINCK